MCGNPVTSDQALSRDWIEFTCDPPVSARYVSVDIPRYAQLILCEVQVSSCDLQSPVNGVAFYLITTHPLLGPTGDNDAFIGAYKGCGDFTATVTFGRQLTTGGSNTGLPSGLPNAEDLPRLGRAARWQKLPGSAGIDRTGVFYSEATNHERTTRIQIIMLHSDGNTVHIRPVQRTLTTNVGDSVTLQMVNVNSPTSAYRWKHNEDAISEWNNQLTVSISNVAVTDEGIYSCFIDGQEQQRLHGIMRLIVRVCPSGMWGPSCSNTCRRCYNGGICDDKTGICICAPSFTGDNCGEAHGSNVFGNNGNHGCGNCQGKYFCPPDPYGCSCAAGYQGLDCRQECEAGMYGADCKQTCHCQDVGTCLKDTGECNNGAGGGCASPYFGSNCQCSTDNGVLGLVVTSGDPNQLLITWQPDSCASGYSMQYELTNTIGDQCVDISSPSQRISIQDTLNGQATYHFITGLESRTIYNVYIRPLYNGIQGPESSISGTTLILPEVVIQSSNSNSPSQIILQWEAVMCADGYKVEYLQTNLDHQCEITSSSVYVQHQDCSCQSTSATISDLDPYSVYLIRVQARIADIYGPAATIEVTTDMSEPTAPPIEVMATSVMQRSLHFSWSEPPCGYRGGIITGYTYKLIEVHVGIVPDNVIQLSLTSEKSVIINGLVPFTEYSFQVAAGTSEGTGPYGDEVYKKTSEAEPTTPLNVNIRNVDDVSITIEWSAPDPPHGIITSYDITYWKSGNIPSQIILSDVDVTPLMYRIMNLETSVTYYIQIRAKTRVGVGPWSDEVTEFTEIGVPGLVQNLHLTNRSVRFISLDWDEPRSPNGQISSYVVEYRILEKPYQMNYDPGSEYRRTDVDASMYQNNNVEPGTKYEFRVSARNQENTGKQSVLQVFTKPLNDQDIPQPASPKIYSDETTDTTITIGMTGVDSEYIVSYVVKVEKVSSQTKREVLIPKHHRDSANDYITAEVPKTDVAMRFVVGDSLMYGGYYNAPLETGASYKISVGAVSKVNDTEANVRFSDSLTITVQQGANGATIAAIILGVIVSRLVLTGIVGCVLWRKRNRMNMPSGSQSAGTEGIMLSEPPKSTHHKTDPSSSDNAGNDIYEDIGLPTWATKWDIKWKNLIIEDKILGKGNFGEVRAGEVKINGGVTKAAIKKLKAGASKAASDDFMTEFQTMSKIGKHPNIVGLLGVCLHEDILHVALEYLPLGNLRDYLRDNRPLQLQSGESKNGISPLTSSNLLTFSMDVAKGMKNLSDAGVIHRDLAARNILLGKDLIAKVSDFGLSRGEDLYVQESLTRVPTRWLAIESLTSRVYVSKSDVWSFGILLWEIVTFGGTPYSGIESRSLAGKLMDGYRMPQPENCADEIYDLMLKCWQEEPSARPSFKELTESLQQNTYLTPTIYENFGAIKPEFDNK